MFQTIRRWAHHPALNVVVGAVMIVTAIGEIFGEAIHELLGFQFGAAHGLLAVGLLHTFKALPDLVDGIGKVEIPRAGAPPAKD